MQAMKNTASILVFALAATAGSSFPAPSAAQGFEPLGRTFPASGGQFSPDLNACRDALTMGNVLFTQEDGLVIIAYDVNVFAIRVTPEGMTCSAVRYIND